MEQKHKTGDRKMYSYIVGCVFSLFNRLYLFCNYSMRLFASFFVFLLKLAGNHERERNRGKIKEGSVYFRLCVLIIQSPFPIWLLFSASVCVFLFSFPNVLFDGNHEREWNRGERKGSGNG